MEKNGLQNHHQSMILFFYLNRYGSGSAHGDQAREERIVVDSLDQERDRLESQGMKRRNEESYAPNNEPQQQYAEPHQEYNEPPQEYRSKPQEQFKLQASKGLSYMEQKKLELLQYQDQLDSYQPKAPQHEQYQPSPPPQEQYQPRASQQEQYQPRASQQEKFQPRASQQEKFQPRASQQEQYQPPAPQQEQYQDLPPQQEQYQPRASQQEQFQPRASQQKQYQDQYGGMTEEEEREIMRRQMELEVDEEILRMKQENDEKLANKYEIMPAKEQYSNPYHEQSSYKTKLVPRGLGIDSHKPDMSNSGKAVRQRPDDSKFLLSGYGDDNAMTKERGSNPDGPVTSSNSYGNYTDSQLSKSNN
jgi:hypothetical protein